MKQSAFTLIELLVVISIMAIVAVALFLNFGSFEENANLKNVTFDIQSYLRVAQSNATTGVKCDGTGGVGWSVSFTGSRQDAVHLKCGTKIGDERTWSLTSPAYIYLIQGDSCNSSFTSSGTIDKAITVKFAYLEGKVSFEDADLTNDCLKNSSNMIITVRKKLDSEEVKTVTINRGGSIDVK